MEGDLPWCFGSSSNNWDLHAMVRFACGGGGRVTPAPNSDESFLSGLPPQPQQQMDTAASWQPLPADPALEDLCLQALLAAAPKPETPQPASPRNETPPKPPTSYRNAGGPTRSRRKKKKSQVSKEVTRVPAGAPSPDPCAWRKYGQKPIKGSPYPRGYYRCSTDNDCKARKQVERCRDDPATLIVTYTGGDHSHPVPLHRNSLAGTTRNKAQPPASTSPGEEPPQLQQQVAPTASSADTKQRQGSPSAPAGMFPATPLHCPRPRAGVEREEEDEAEAVAASLLLQDAEMEGEDDVLQFLKPAAGPDDGTVCKDTMLFPEPNEADPGGGCWVDDVKLSPLSNHEPQQNVHEHWRGEIPSHGPSAVGGSCSDTGSEQLGAWAWA
ncbi:WRKY transcription factor 22-like [Panicum virgatum]|uniref:WRKY transcription factor 22-like n=1 Tax=Panicum virgatum TaxID=38727 RepID=UPI0019D5DC2C|nr:WRKY transcription factor 22-like [Panicum virgatum]